MRLTLIFVYSLYMFLYHPDFQNQAAPCPAGSSKSASITYNFREHNDAQQRFNDQVLSYLNVTGSRQGLDTAIEANSNNTPGDQPQIRAQVVEYDITGEGQADLLVDIDITWGSSYQHILSLYTCQAKKYVLLNSLLIAENYDLYSAPGAHIEAIVDLNVNKRPEIIMVQGYIPRRSYRAIVLYEWKGDSLKEVFSTDYDLGISHHVQLQNTDDNPATLELMVDDRYGYGQETAMSANEIVRWRDIRRIIRWDGSAYVQFCQYFTDTPSTLFETLHSAEAYRACGDYTKAEMLYQTIINNPTLERWQYIYSKVLVIPESVTDDVAYVGELEQSYLIPFAYYRLIQLALNDQKIEQAIGYYEWMKPDYPKGEHGYQYVAMADALLKNYQQSQNLKAACQAAKIAFDTAKKNGDDPGITYFMNPAENDRPAWHYGFYYESTNTYSADPDNLPDGDGGLVSISVCL